MHISFEEDKEREAVRDEDLIDINKRINPATEHSPRNAG